MASAITFDQHQSTSFSIPEPISVSKSVLSKSLIEMLPESQVNYKYGGVQTMRFRIADAKQVLLGAQSYLRWEIYRTANGVDSSVALDEGGVHALIRRLTIRQTQGSTMLQPYTEYNRLFALMSNIHQSPQEVEQVGRNYGDSVFATGYNDGGLSSVSPTALSGRIEGFNAASGVVTGSNTAFIRDVRPGDILTIVRNGMTAQVLDAEAADNPPARVNVQPMTFKGVVKSVISNTALTIQETNADFNFVPNSIEGVGAVGNTLDAYYMIERRHGSLDSRIRVVDLRSTEANDNKGFVVEFRPFCAFLEHNIPLFLFPGGIELEIELENPNVAMHAVTDAGGSVYDYEIRNPRFMAMCVQPSQDVTNMFLNRWRSDSGLIFNTPSYKVMKYVRQSSADHDNIQIHAGVHSIRKIHAICCNQEQVEGATQLVRLCKSLSTYHRAGITGYQYRVGAEEFPKRMVEWHRYPNYPSEAYQQFLDINGNDAVRFPIDDYYSTKLVRNTVAEMSLQADSNKFIISVDFSRDNGPGSSMTGVDGSLVPIDFSIRRDGGSYVQYFGAGTPVYYFFIQHDAFVQVNSRQTVVRT